MPAPAAPKISETRWQRIVGFLLYGRHVDREAKTKARLGLAIVAFVAIYGAISLRLVMFAVASHGHGSHHTFIQDAVATARPDILDRNGKVIAIDVKAPSLYAEPRKLIDVDDAEEQLTAAMPDLNSAELRKRLSSKRGFVWLKREITPQQKHEIRRLGIPGIGFLTENKRVYPEGPLFSHVVGLVNIDNQGIAGMEKWLDEQGLAALHMAGLATGPLQRPVTLSLDTRVQFALRDELVKARDKYHAKAAAGLVLNVNTGEVIALVSEPDYNPNNPTTANDPSRINRITTGVFELGSTFKVLTVAMALNDGKATLASKFDATHPLHYGRFAIHDFEPQHRWLTVPEIFTYSSNIGAARMAMAVGVDGHKAFLGKLGQLTRLQTELPESAAPLVPQHWSELSTMTIAFGHGLSVAPLQAAMGIAACVNGGLLIKPTFLKRDRAQAMEVAKRVLKPETSRDMRYLMRLNAEKGTATFANVKGYYVGGKTGTADKVIDGRYSKHQVLTDFMAILPADHPKYLVMTMLDEPQAVPGTHGFNTAGWNVGPTSAKVIARIAPLLGIEPRFDLPDAKKLILADETASQ
jgi:cell division protein FtsI (penicillin-binding protein 3)